MRVLMTHPGSQRNERCVPDGETEEALWKSWDLSEDPTAKLLI